MASYPQSLSQFMCLSTFTDLFCHAVHPPLILSHATDLCYVYQHMLIKGLCFCVAAALQGKPLARVSVTFDAFELSLGRWKVTVPLTAVKPTGETP